LGGGGAKPAFPGGPLGGWAGDCEPVANHNPPATTAIVTTNIQ
jgi:hypothetical protein